MRFQRHLVQSNGFGKDLRDLGEKWNKVPRQFQSMPVTSKHAPLGGVNIWHQDIEDPSRSQPLGDSLHDFPWLVKMFENIETGDDIKGFSRELSIQDVADENRAPLRASAVRRGFAPTSQFQRDAKFAAHGLQERPRTTTEVERLTGLLECVIASMRNPQRAGFRRLRKSACHTRPYSADASPRASVALRAKPRSTTGQRTRVYVLAGHANGLEPLAIRGLRFENRPDRARLAIF